MSHWVLIIQVGSIHLQTWKKCLTYSKKKEWSTVEFKSNLNKYKYDISDLKSELYRLISIAKIPADA